MSRRRSGVEGSGGLDVVCYQVESAVGLWTGISRQSCGACMCVGLMLRERGGSPFSHESRAGRTSVWAADGGPELAVSFSSHPSCYVYCSAASRSSGSWCVYYGTPTMIVLSKGRNGRRQYLLVQPANHDLLIKQPCKLLSRSHPMVPREDNKGPTQYTQRA